MAKMYDFDEDEELQGESIELEDSLPEVEDTEDGGAILNIGDEEDERETLEHFANIVEEVDKEMLDEAVDD